MPLWLRKWGAAMVRFFCICPLLAVFLFIFFCSTASAETQEQQLFIKYLNAKRALARCQSAACYQSAYGQYATAAERKRLQGLSQDKLTAEFKLQKEMAEDDISDQGLHVEKLEADGNLRRLYLVSRSNGDKEILAEFLKEQGEWKLAHP